MKPKLGGTYDINCLPWTSDNSAKIPCPSPSRVPEVPLPSRTKSYELTSGIRWAAADFALPSLLSM